MRRARDRYLLALSGSIGVLPTIGLADVRRAYARLGRAVDWLAGWAIVDELGIRSDSLNGLMFDDNFGDDGAASGPGQLHFLFFDVAAMAGLAEEEFES